MSEPNHAPMFAKGGPEGNAADWHVDTNICTRGMMQYTGHATATAVRQAFLDGIRWERERNAEKLGQAAVPVCDHTNCTVNTRYGDGFGTCTRCGGRVEFPRFAALSQGDVV